MRAILWYIFCINPMLFFSISIQLLVPNNRLFSCFSPPILCHPPIVRAAAAAATSSLHAPATRLVEIRTGYQRGLRCLGERGFSYNVLQLDSGSLGKEASRCYPYPVQMHRRSMLHLCKSRKHHHPPLPLARPCRSRRH
ncbi:hypothetical protein SETIT_9G050300v2 [Setaria italica]|uniref:Uncharacterized protein n=1 Tax=Setaria italica TaxID=4555 RepID=A0A368SDA1_SETIT|nr:hypothetical protein SETIT_9G050300v2 [Setaria italica]